FRPPRVPTRYSPDARRAGGRNERIELRQARDRIPVLRFDEAAKLLERAAVDHGLACAGDTVRPRIDLAHQLEARRGVERQKIQNRALLLPGERAREDAHVLFRRARRRDVGVSSRRDARILGTQLEASHATVLVELGDLCGTDVAELVHVAIGVFVRSAARYEGAAVAEL